MKTAILSLMFLAVSTAFAAQPQPETTRVVGVLLHSPAVVAELNKEWTDRLVDVEIVENKALPGVTDYTLTFKRSCFCMERTATVKVNEDLRPTFADGPPKYTSAVSFK